MEGGNLPVKSATNKMDNLVNFILENGPSYNKIILTVVWHPHTHCSFMENGGELEQHCIQHSKGASIYEPILESLNTIKSDYTILTKGTDEDREEHSIFKNKKSKTKLLNECSLVEATNIDVAGIDLELCVLNSIKDGLRELPNTNFHLLIDFCPSSSEEWKNEVINFVENTERICLG